MQWLLVSVLLATVGLTCAQNNIPDDVSQLADKIPGLDGIDKSKIPTMDNAEKLFKDKCIKYGGGEEAFENAKNAKEVLEQCIKSQVNITELQEEMEEAKPTGDLDMVFGKYCKKTPVVLECIKNFTAALDPCLDEKEKDNKAMVLNITESLSSFLCYKDGDRIAMFIAEGGLECLQDKQEEIQNCANVTFGKKVPKDVPDIDNLPLLIIEQEQCDDLTVFQECVVTELEKCSEPTPANIMESLFKFIRRVTPCDKMQSKTNRGSSAKRTESSNSSASTAVLSSMLMILGAVLLQLN